MNRFTYEYLFSKMAIPWKVLGLDSSQSPFHHGNQGLSSIYIKKPLTLQYKSMEVDAQLPLRGTTVVEEIEKKSFSASDGTVEV